MKNVATRIASVFFILLLCVSYSSATAKEDKKPPRVILVSIDGLSATMAPQMVTLVALMDHGSWTLKARAPMPSITVVSHAAMFTGASPAKNGVKNFEPAASKLEKWRPLKVRTVFQAVYKATGRAPESFIQKMKLYGLLPREASLVTVRHELDSIVLRACDALERNDKPFIFIHFGDVDGAGHAHGWGSKEQSAAAEEVDNALFHIGRCATEAEEKQGQEFVWVVTADHGGHSYKKKGKTRGTHGKDLDSDRNIPWIVVGPGIKVNYEITGSVDLMDTAPTILRIMGLDPKTLLPDAEGKVVEDIFANP